MIVATENLSKEYDGIYRVQDLDIRINERDIYGFLGPNGAGKSTTMKMLLGLVKPSKGSIEIMGKPFNEKNRQEILKSVGSLIESPSYYGHLTGKENMEIIRRLLTLPRKNIEEAVHIVRMENQMDKKVKNYSLGMGYTMDGFRRAVRAKMDGKKEDAGKPKPDGEWYRVRKTWADASSQKGAFKSLENAKECADGNPGYSVFDESGKAVYTKTAAFKPYLVRVSIPDMNIRKGPGTGYGKTGKYTGAGTFTIVEEADGEGASRWGLLKSYQSGRNGWVSLDFAERV